MKKILISKNLSILALFIIAFSLMSYNSSSDSPEKFWGSSIECSETYELEPGSCYQNCTTRYQAFWLVISEETEYGIPC